MSNTNRYQDKPTSKFSITVTNEEMDIANIYESMNEIQDSHLSLSASYKPHSSYPETYKSLKRARVVPKEINKFVSRSFEGNEPTLPPFSLANQNRSAILPSNVYQELKIKRKLNKKKNSCTASCLII
jgi:hypothetical protein